MPGSAASGMVEASVECDGRTSTVRRFYISSAAPSAERSAEVARARRRIEDAPHRLLDTALDEDPARDSREHGPENFATPREPALDVLRPARPDLSIPRERERSGWSDGFARSVLGQMRRPCPPHSGPLILPWKPWTMRAPA